MSFERVKQWLAERGYGDRAVSFDVSSATVPLAARALGVEEARIAKTLSFKGADDEAIIVVAAGDARVDNPRFKAQFGLKARMLTPEEALELTGFQVGGVCPFDLKPGARLYLDASLKRFDTVYPACGSANSAVRVTPDELQHITQGEWVDVCKLPAVE